jgi:hypothetical protein
MASLVLAISTKSREALLCGNEAPNPSIELTRPGKPGHAAHVKR